MFFDLNSSFSSRGPLRCTKSSKQGLTQLLGSCAAVSLSRSPFPLHVLIPSTLTPHLPAVTLPAPCKVSASLTLLSLNWYKVSKLVPSMEKYRGEHGGLQAESAPCSTCRGELIVCLS